MQARVGAERAPDELVRVLVPVLLHKLNNTTQYLSALQALLSEPGLEAARASALAGLTATAHDVDDLGWILGLVANVTGADVMLERRETSRLTALVGLVAECVRRAGREIADPQRAWPALDTQPDGWRVAWVAARALYSAARSLSEGACLTWEIVAPETAQGGVVLVCRVPRSDAVERAWSELRELEPRIAIRLEQDACALILPGFSTAHPAAST